MWTTADTDAGQLGGGGHGRSERDRQALDDGPDHGGAALRSGQSPLAIPGRDPAGHVTRWQEPRIVGVEDLLGCGQGGRLVKQRGQFGGPAPSRSYWRIVSLSSQAPSRCAGSAPGPRTDLVGEVGVTTAVGDRLARQLKPTRPPSATRDVGRRLGLHWYRRDRRGGVMRPDGHHLDVRSAEADTAPPPRQHRSHRAARLDDVAEQPSEHAQAPHQVGVPGAVEAEQAGGRDVGALSSSCGRSASS